MSLSPMNPISALDTSTTHIISASVDESPLHSTERKVKHIKKIIKRRITRDKDGNQTGETVEESYIPINSPSHIANDNSPKKSPHLLTGLPFVRQKQDFLPSSPFSTKPLRVIEKIMSIDLTGDTSDDDDGDTHHILRKPFRQVKREQEYSGLGLSPRSNLSLSSPTVGLHTAKEQNQNARQDAQKFLTGKHVKDMSIIPRSTDHRTELNTSNTPTRNVDRPLLTIDTITSPSPSSSSSSSSPLSMYTPHRNPISNNSLRQDRNKAHGDGRTALRRHILPESITSISRASLHKPPPVPSQLLISSSTNQSPSSSTNTLRKDIGIKPNTTLLTTKSPVRPSPSRVRSGYHMASFMASSIHQPIHSPSNITITTYPLPKPSFSQLSPVSYSPQSSFPMPSPATLTLRNTREGKSINQPELSSPTSKRSLSFHPRRISNSTQSHSEFPREKQQQQLEQHNDPSLQKQQIEIERKNTEREKKKELEMILLHKNEEMRNEEAKKQEKQNELKFKPKDISTLSSAFLASPPPPLFTQTISSLSLRSSSPMESPLISSFNPKARSPLSSKSREAHDPHISSLPLYNLDLELGFQAETLLSPLDIFLRAVFIGDATTVARILDDSAKRAETNPDKNKSSFLHLLPENQYQALFHTCTKLERKLPIASLALERGADINAHEKSSLTSSLALAVQFGPPHTWQFLIEKGADLHCGSLSFNCVQHAILQRNISFLRDCVHHGVNIDISHVRIQLAPEDVEVGNKKWKEREPEKEKRKMTIGTGVMKDMGYGSPLQFAVMMGQFVIIPDLLQILTKENKCAFDVNPTPVQYQWSLLHQLVVSTSFTLQEEIIIRLVELGVNLEALDENGQTPFLSALQFNNTQAALVLLECGTNPTVIDGRGQNALHIILSSTVTLDLESVLRKICEVIVEKQSTEEGAKKALAEFLLAKSDMLQMRTIDWIQIMRRDVSLSLESTSLADHIRSDFKSELVKWTKLERIITILLEHYKISDLPESL